MKGNNILHEITNALNRAHEAEGLLEEILSFYDIYSGEFRPFESDESFKVRISKRISPELRATICHPRDKLNERIRQYRGFDDSE